MTTALALHVADEAIHDFLPFYNELVSQMQDSLGFSPIPTFSYTAWLGGLIAFIVICFALTPIVRRGGRFIRWFTIVLGIIMIGNALGHMIGSIYFGRLTPGFWSSPVLLPAAVFVVVRGLRGEWEQARTAI